MFKSFKLYAGENLDLDFVLGQLVDFGYLRQDAAREEGDFSRRGGIIDIFPFTFELPIRIELDNNTIQSIRTFNPEDGQPLWEHKVAIILPIKKAAPHKKIAFSEEYPLANFLDLKAGDFVVHNQYGIGKFLGFQKIKVHDQPKDHIVIEYDLQEKLYVPTDTMHLVQKYISFQARRPKLYRLGGKEWLRVKNRARRGIQKMAWDLLALQAMRQALPGFAYSADTEWQKQFEATFAFQETPDQLKATLEVKQDMQAAKPMDRLLCGDVGYGKTEVAMRAAFKAVMDNKQVAYLVPTTILAEQHFQNFRQRLVNFPLNVELLCRFKTPSEQRRAIAALKSGSCDIVIGTHRLLSDDVIFKNLGLVIIDEEQRFGVRHKEKLKKMRLSCDVLTLSATPIPRTLYMSLMGARDMSVINTPPQNRLPIKTIVVEYDLELVRQAIEREVKRNGQVFYLHNRIQDIEKVKARLEQALPREVRLAAAHGQMRPKALERVMLDFLNKKIDCLVCTMIIESGIDMPNVNTIILDNALIFGLADLHQLRGRVGRFNRTAYAYFLVPRHAALEQDARKRLNAIQEYAHLGAGFSIAMEDLEIRGAGNLLGAQLHGFISAVGFDLYCRLLREAVTTFQKGGVA
ncbi:MAG: transcription-repair coupling factor [Candidatus Omnitrophota bacterium]|nr:transcription-repair coupling factor [Candidatus Omnitrophota bacterium]